MSSPELLLQSRLSGITQSLSHSPPGELEHSSAAPLRTDSKTSPRPPWAWCASSGVSSELQERDKAREGLARREPARGAGETTGRRGRARPTPAVGGERGGWDSGLGDICGRAGRATNVCASLPGTGYQLGVIQRIHHLLGLPAGVDGQPWPQISGSA